MEHDILKTVILPYTNFVLFALVFFIVARKPLVAMFVTRRDAFLALFKDSKKQVEEAKARHLNLETKLKNLDSDLEKLMADAKNDASRKAQEIILRAKEQAENITKESAKVAEAEFAAVEQKLRQELISHVTNAVVGKMQNELSKEMQLKLIDQRINKLEVLKR